MHTCSNYEEFETKLLLSISAKYDVPLHLLSSEEDKRIMSEGSKGLVLHLVDDTGEQRNSDRIARMLDLIRLVVSDEGFDLAMYGNEETMKKYINTLESTG